MREAGGMLSEGQINPQVKDGELTEIKMVIVMKIVLGIKQE